MVRFHHLSSFGATFYDVGVDGALTQEFDAIEFASFFFEDADKFAANDFAFFLRVGHTGEFAEEAFGGINID